MPMSAPQSSPHVGKESICKKWDIVEDITLMSAWCIASESKIVGKNQRKEALWTRVKKLYDEAQVKNPQEIGKRNNDQMRGRFKRLNESANKWIAAYQEAYRQRLNGMSLKDVENHAHKIFEQEHGCKFNDFVVFDKVMSKYSKWDFQINHDTMHFPPECEVGNEESGGSTKRSRTTEEGEYGVNFNQENPASGAKEKEKCKAPREFAEELHVMRLTRDDELEVMRKRLEFDQQLERNRQEREHYKQKRHQKVQEMEQQKQERERENLQLLHLNTLLAKQSLSPEEADIKRYLMTKFYGK